MSDPRNEISYLSATLFLRLLRHDDKPAALADALAAHRAGVLHPDLFSTDPASFAQVPGSPFAYWVGQNMRRVFVDSPPFESEGRMVLGGLKTLSDERFIRAWW